MARMTDEELVATLTEQLPDLLERHPEYEPAIYGWFLKTFARKEETVNLLQQIQAIRAIMEKRFNGVDARFDKVDARFDKVDARFDKVDARLDKVDARFDKVDARLDKLDAHAEQTDKRFEQVDKRFVELTTEMREGFKNVQKQIDRLGARWGIRNESLFRETIAALLEQSFGVTVEQRTIQGEQFDILIFDGQHILVEIAASVGPEIEERLTRKQSRYEQTTGVAPARMILATASIHSRRAQALREKGIEVIEPEESALA